MKEIERQYVFPSYEIGALKPHTEAFRAVKEAIGCEYDEMMFIDDKIKNVEAAKALGICGIVYRKNTVFDEVKRAVASENSNHHEQTPLQSPQDMTR